MCCVITCCVDVRVQWQSLLTPQCDDRCAPATCQAVFKCSHERLVCIKWTTFMSWTLHLGCFLDFMWAHVYNRQAPSFTDHLLSKVMFHPRIYLIPSLMLCSDTLSRHLEVCVSILHVDLIACTVVCRVKSRRPLWTFKQVGSRIQKTMCGRERWHDIAIMFSAWEYWSPVETAETENEHRMCGVCNFTHPVAVDFPSSRDLPLSAKRCADVACLTFSNIVLLHRSAIFKM